jgi:tRNA (mo5U34)-methyltransferase
MICWHTFDFPEFKTKGLDNSPEKLKFIKMPEDLTDWTVLDIGCWDGYFSFVAEKRGAKKVIAFDSPNHAWAKNREVQGKKIEDGKAVFLEVRKKLKSKVLDVEGELEELTNLIINGEQSWDLVLDLGILYHTLDPYKHIRDLYKITNKLLILETHIDLNNAPYPVMRFYPNGEINNDSGTIWGPNMMCVNDMLTKAGFKITYVDYQNGRGVFHAEK